MTLLHNQQIPTEKPSRQPFSQDGTTLAEKW